jgi:hypothetical protein
MDNSPRPTDSWFSPTVAYSGVGRATFRQPALVVTGTTTARFNEDGSAEIVMAPDSLPDRAAIVFSGAPPRDNDTSIEWEISDLTGNPCESLVITTPEGAFETIGAVSYGYDLRGAPRLTFRGLRGAFRSLDTVPAKYWVLPLQNFHTGFTERYAPLDPHPLRLNPPPAEIVAMEDQHAARFAAAGIRLRSAHPLIAFKFLDALGFIEPLPDYANRKRRLQERAITRALTTVMVGETGGNSIEPETLDTWLPFDYLGLLGLACGTEVGAPWVEFRDASGGLVARIHGQMNAPCFTDTRGAIDEGLHRYGIRTLLMRAVGAPDFKADHVRVALKLLLRGGWEAPSAEDRLVQLCRALETLCTGYGLTAECGPELTLAALSAEERQELDAALGEVKRRIRELERRARQAKNVEEADLLLHMSNQARNADRVRPGFARAAIALMERFGLHDAAAMQAFEQANRITGESRWLRKLVAYRNVPTHVGYFNFRDAAYDVVDVVRFSTHLHDILTRLLLRMVEYDGLYQPTVQVWTDAQRVTWVQSDTPAERFGYV